MTQKKKKKKKKKKGARATTRGRLLLEGDAETGRRKNSLHVTWTSFHKFFLSFHNFLEQYQYMSNCTYPSPNATLTLTCYKGLGNLGTGAGKEEEHGTGPEMTYCGKLYE